MAACKRRKATLLATLLVLLLLGWNRKAVLSAEVIAPPEATFKFEAPPVDWYIRDQPLTIGILKQIERKDILNVVNFGPYIAFTFLSGDTISFLKKLQAAGAIGVLLGDPLSEFAGTYDLPTFANYNRSALSIPITQIGNKDYIILKQYVSQFGNVTISMGGPINDRNYWLEVRKSPVMIVIQVAMSIFCAFAAAFALAKLFGYVLSRGIRFEIPHVCLFCVFGANFIRLLFYSLDPNFMIRNVFSYTASNFLLTIPHPFYIASQLALAMYWTELVTKISSVIVSLKLRTLKWPFIITTLVVLILEILAVVLRSLDQDTSTAILISAVITCIVALASSGFFAFTSFRVISALKHSSSGDAAQGSKERVARKTLRLVIITIVCSVLFVLTTIFIVIDPIFYHPIAFYTLLTLKDVWLTAVSISQTATFKTVKKRMGKFEETP